MYNFTISVPAKILCSRKFDECSDSFLSGFVFFELVKSILDGGVAEVLDTGVGTAGIG